VSALQCEAFVWGLVIGHSMACAGEVEEVKPGVHVHRLYTPVVRSLHNQRRWRLNSRVDPGCPQTAGDLRGYCLIHGDDEKF
jgi:hypothetical protein